MRIQLKTRRTAYHASRIGCLEFSLTPRCCLCRQDAKGKAARAEMDKLVGRDVNERLKGVSPASKEEVAAFAVKVHACLEQYPPHMR